MPTTKILLVEDDKTIIRSLKAFLSEEGFEVDSVSTQFEAENHMGEGFDLLLLDISLAQGSGFEVCKKAKDAGIPVILVDRQINADPSLYAGFLGENGVEEGRRAARFLLSKCRDRTENVTIFEMSGTENSSIVKNRARGFREIINTDPKFQIIHSENGDFLRSRGKEICDVLLANNVRENGNTTNTLYFDGQKIDAVFSHNDSMTLGFLDSLQAHKVNAKNTIFITIDAEQESIDALKDGKLNCVVECNPNLGPMLMELVKQIAAGNTIPHITYNNETVFTEDDDFSFYEPRGY